MAMAIVVMIYHVWLFLLISTTITKRTSTCIAFSIPSSQTNKAKILPQSELINRRKSPALWREEEDSKQNKYAKDSKKKLLLCQYAHLK